MYGENDGARVYRMRHPPFTSSIGILAMKFRNRPRQERRTRSGGGHRLGKSPSGCHESPDIFKGSIQGEITPSTENEIHMIPEPKAEVLNRAGHIFRASAEHGRGGADVPEDDDLRGNAFENVFEIYAGIG